jgi:hypothetical protein
VLPAVRDRLAEAEAALARGDWVAFGAAMEALKGLAEPESEADPMHEGELP